jgi:chromosome segregation ATPase
VAGVTGGVPVPLPNEPTPIDPTETRVEAEDDATVAELVEELANRDVRLAELENDNIELRLAYQRRGDEVAETQGLLEDSQARVELLEQRLAEAMDQQQELLMQQARHEVQKAQSQLQGENAAALAEAEREIAVARSIIANLESEVEGKETKLAALKTEIAALRNILRNVDARAIEAAKKRMGG